MQVHLTLIAGFCLLLGAVSLGGREILLAPGMPNYPTAPTWRRALMFVYMLGLAGRGIQLVLSCLPGQPPPIPVDGWGVGLSLLLAGYHAGEAVYVLRLRLPAYFYRHMSRAVRLNQCGGKKGRQRAVALQVLQFEGVPVALPGEMPGDVPGLGRDAVLH